MVNIVYLVIIGLFGGFNPKIEKFSDIGVGSFVPVLLPTVCLKLPTLSSILFLSSVLPSNPSHIGITLLIFLEGDN
jgi:hypothetical protein